MLSSSTTGPPLELTEDDPRTLPAALVRAARRFGDAGLVTDAGHLGYPELLDTARRLLGGLRARGAGPGDTAVLHGLPLPDVFTVFWACLLGGIRPALIADPSQTGRLRHTTSLLRPALVISSLDDCPAGPPVTDLPDPDWSETALYMLSSGSTGAPKATRITHRGLAEFAAATAAVLPVRPGEVFVNWLPVDHSGALFLFHVLPLFAGATNVHAPTEAVLADPLCWLDLMSRHRANHSWSPTFGLQLVADALDGVGAVNAADAADGWDLSAMRGLICGGEQIQVPVVSRFFAATERFGLRPHVFRPAWGMAETVTAITIGRYTEPGGVQRVRKPSLAGELAAAGPDEPDADCVTFVAVGGPSPGAAVRVVSETGTVLQERHIGRLQVRSTRVTPGYAGRDDPMTEDGWLRTGDLAFVADGQVVVTGREQDVIILNGHNHFCHEIEQVAGAVDGVSAGGVGAIGVPDERTGTESLVVCFASPEPGAPAAGEVAAAIRRELFTRLRLTASDVVAVPEPEFPRTSSRKVRRGELRRRVLAASSPASPHAPAPASPGRPASPAGRPEVTVERVRSTVAEVLGAPVEVDTPFYELGMTSVTLVRARSRLESELGVPVAATALFEHPTVTALTAHLSGVAPAPIRPSPAAGDGRIAVIGMALRFPGASTVEQFWANLRDGVCSVSRFDRAGPADFVPVGGAIEDATAFDPEFFGIPAREAGLMDPAHRLFLQCAYHALEDGGYAAALPGTRIGVYAGCGMNLYGHQSGSAAGPNGDPATADLVTAMQATIGLQPDFLASRVAYRLGLSGPAVGVQTACSTALVAVHLAVQALLTGDADLALAGAAAINLPQDGGYRVYPGSILSPSGRCRTFDADADGTVGGNGVAAVLLKPLDRAIADGDTVHAVILGSAVNNDGARKVGFAAPSVSGQVDVIRSALARAGADPSTISYVEAHGTGTQLGDPVEVEALRQAFSQAPPGSCVLGSVKPNVGHLDSCAGLAGLIKTVLMLRHGRLVPLAGLDRPNPQLQLDGGPFVLGTSSRPWDAPVRRAGVSSFGVGGTNAHVVLQEPPASEHRRADSRRLAVLPLSARSPQSLVELAGALRGRLAAEPQPAVADVATSLALGRPHLPHRLAVSGRSAGELVRSLDDAVDQLDRFAARPVRPLAFAFAGQGSARPGMAADLYDEFDVVRATLDECEQLYRDEFGGGLLDLLRTPGSEPVWPTATAQPALFAYGVAMARWFASVGVEPDHVVGHSVGEYPALCVAGALSVADGLRLCAVRGRLMTSTPAGGLLAVRADADLVAQVARSAGLEVAAVNGPRSHVLAGPQAAVERAAESLTSAGVPWQRLAVDRAFHSALLDPILPALRDACSTVRFTPLRLPLASATTGELLPAGTLLDADYVLRQTRSVARFDRALASLGGCSALVDLGPGDVVTGLGSAVLPDKLWVSATHRSLDPVPSAGQALADLYRHGLDLDWSALAGGGRRIPLPHYPFQRRHFDPPARPAAGVPSPTPSPTSSPSPSLTSSPTSSLTVPPAGPAQPDALPGVLAGVRELTAERLGAEPATLDIDSTFLQLGADSLALMGLTRQVDQRFGVTIPVRELFAGADTPRRLADLVATRTAPAPPPAPAPAPGGTRAPQVMPGGTEAPQVRAGNGDAPLGNDGSVAAVLDRQLRLTERLVDRVSNLMERQLELLNAAPAAARTAAPPAAPVTTPVAAPVTGPVVGAEPAMPVQQRAVTAEPRDTPAEAVATAAGVGDTPFSLYFFGDYPERSSHDKYELIVQAAKFADEHGFHALWLPERHFHSFGALFPNPSVLAAALSGHTRRIRLHAGSVVLPLHSPFRVAEEWSVVDNLSGGRVGLCVASGWHANDFVLAPQNYGRHRELMYEQLDTVRRLWAGEEVEGTSGSGEQIRVRLHPAPIQNQPPMFAAVVGNPESYRKAAQHDLGVVTNLMAQSVEQLAANIARYRSARAEHGLDPDAGRVVVLLHSYLGDDLDQVRREAFEPFCDYLRSSLSLFNQVTNSLGFELDLDATPEDDVAFMLEQAYRRYCESRALIGTVDSCAEVVDAVLAAGADEIAGFVDFGVATGKVLDALPALDALRRRYQADQPTPTPTPTPAPVPATAATPAQRRIWFLERMYPGRISYHEPKAIRFDGPLDIERLRGALQRVVRRQPALRTVFVESGGQPQRIVLDRMEIELEVQDHTGRPEPDALRDVLRGDGRTVLDLATGPLLLARLLRLAETRHVMFMSAHHIVFDSASTAVFTRDLAAFYRAWPDEPVDLPPLPATEHVRATSAVDLDFWRAELAGAPTLRLPADRPRPPVGSGAGASVTHELGAELTERLRRFGREHGVTVFATLLAATGAVLGRFSGQDDIVVGTAVSDRPPGAEHAVGLYLDTLPLRIRLGGRPGFDELARRVLDTSLRALEHRDIQFDDLVGALNPDREPGRNPLFDVMVEFENATEDVEFDPPELAATLLDVPTDRAPFDISLYLSHHRNGVRCMIEYSTELFDEGTVRRLLDYLEHVLRVAVADPAAPLEVGVTGADRALLAGSQGAPAEPEPCLHELFERAADADPTAPALISDAGTVSYAELDRLANRLANRLGRRRGELVGVCLPRGAQLIAALLGVLKSGAGYLPIDPGLPAKRRQFMLADSGTTTVVTNGALATDLDQVTEIVLMDTVLMDTVLMDTDDAVTDAASRQRPDFGVTPDDLAYCMYTSGSTGRPKGVLLTHRGPANLVAWQRRQHPPLRTLQWTAPAFDISAQEIFSTLAAGAALVVIDDDARYDPAAVAAAIRRHGVQRLFMPLTPLKYLVQAQPELPSLRMICCGGEAVEVTPALRRFLAEHPRIELHNHYGPTEASIIACTHPVDPDAGAWPPIGRPVDNVRIDLLDPDGGPVPVGAIGEICIGGPIAAALGYLGRPAETATAFRPGETGRTYRTGDLGRLRSDGQLQFLGRVDDQVKIRGYRVEPGEVQQALTALDGVADAAVLARPDRAGEQHLVAYVVPAGELDVERIATELARSLPGYLVPQRWVRMDRLPVNSSGKLDRSRLPEPEQAPAGAAPRTDLERRLADLWRAELGTAGSIGVDQPFFRLGGHSLTAVRLLNRVRDELGIDCSLTDFFRAPTIRAMAAAGQVVDSVPLCGMQPRTWRLHHWHPFPAIYNVPHRVDIRGPLDPEALRRAFEALVRRHCALRMRVVDGTAQVLAEVPVELPVVDLPEDGVPAWCDEVTKQVFDLSRGPLFRLRLARLAPDRWVLAVVLSHLVCDGWSMGLIWDELAALYRGTADATGAELPPAPQFPDYARWQHAQLVSEDRARLDAFWHAALDGAPPCLDLPYDHPRPAKLSGRGAIHEQPVPADLLDRVQATAAAAGTTAYVVLGAAFARWASRLTGQPDLVVTISSANRTRREHEGIVGEIGDVVPIRIQPPEATGDLLAEYAARLYAAMDHPMPLELLIPRLDPGHQPYPQVLFTVVTTPPPELHLPGLDCTVHGLPIAGVARSELYIVIAGRTLIIEYATDLFEPGTIAAWAKSLLATVDELTT